MITRERIEALREHVREGRHTAMIGGFLMYDEWEQLATLALEAETLRTALAGIVTGIDSHHPKFAAGPFTLTRQEIAAARAALGGDS